MGRQETLTVVGRRASCQHGVISRAQLLEMGLSRNQIQRRIHSGYLLRLHPGVYAVGHCSLTARSRWMAAVLLGGSGAALSHRSAAALWGLSQPCSPIEVVRTGRTLRCHGLTIHRTTVSLDSDRTLVDGIPVTTVARTLIDLAAGATPRYLDDRLSAARRLGLLDLKAMSSALVRLENRTGAPELSRLLRMYEQSNSVTRSELETRFLRLCGGAGLALPETDVTIGGRIVDFLWRRQRLIVEVDSVEFHRHRFDEDRTRDLGHLVNGYRTIRVTYQMMESAPGRLVASLRKLLVDQPGEG